MDYPEEGRGAKGQLCQPPQMPLHLRLGPSSELFYYYNCYQIATNNYRIINELSIKNCYNVYETYKLHILDIQILFLQKKLDPTNPDSTTHERVNGIL